MNSSINSLPTMLFSMFLSSADYFQNQLFVKLFQEYHQCRTIRFQIRSKVLFDLIWIQSVYKGYQQLILVDKEINIHVRVSIGAKGLTLDLSIHPCSFLVFASDKGSGRSGHFVGLI